MASESLSACFLVRVQYFLRSAFWLHGRQAGGAGTQGQWGEGSSGGRLSRLRSRQRLPARLRTQGTHTIHARPAVHHSAAQHRSSTAVQFCCTCAPRSTAPSLPSPAPRCSASPGGSPHPPPAAPAPAQGRAARWRIRRCGGQGQQGNSMRSSTIVSGGQAAGGADRQAGRQAGRLHTYGHTPAQHVAHS